MSEINTQILQDGQLAIRTVVQNGTVVSGVSATDTTALVQTAEGKQLCVKTVLVGPGGDPHTQEYAYMVQQLVMNKYQTQTIINANDLVRNTASLNPFVLDLSENTVLTKLTATGTSENVETGLTGVIVSPQAPLDNVTSPQIDVSYTGLNKAALVNLFNSMPYNVGYTTEGSPTITDGVASGFSDSNYLKVAGSFSEEGDIDIVVELTTDDLTAQQYPFSWNCKPASANRHCGLYIIQDGKYGFLVRDTADNNYQNTAPFAYALSANTTYSLRLSFTAADKSLKMGASTDGVNYTYGINITLTANLCPMNGNVIQMGRAIPSNNSFLGSIDLNETYIKVNGKPFFRGTAAVTKTVSVVGCTGTADLTAEDKAIAEDKGWAITLS